jgi:hypothetical protein
LILLTAEPPNYGEIMSGDTMFWPQLALCATAVGLVLASGPAAAQAQTVGPVNPLLATVSAQAGIPYRPGAKPGVTVVDIFDPAESRLCVRAGLGLSVPMMSGPQMTVEHGLFGCPTNTGGLPVIVLQDPALQFTPTSRTGQYNLDLTVRYRLLQFSHLQLVASASEQGVGYSFDTPVSGNNLLLAVSLLF